MPYIDLRTGPFSASWLWTQFTLGVYMFGKFIKSVVVTMILSSTSLVLANAFLSQNQQKLTASAMKLLDSKSQELIYEGDVHSGDKLQGLFQSMKEYEAEILEKLQNGESIENLKSSILNIIDECHMIAPTNTAQCQLMVNFKPLGETTLRFKVLVGENFEVTEILDNKVNVIRGD